jgi:hypothetical protein
LYDFAQFGIIEQLPELTRNRTLPTFASGPFIASHFIGNRFHKKKEKEEQTKRVKIRSFMNPGVNPTKLLISLFF